MAILTGILLGLSTLAFIGPVLFYLLKSSLEHGTKAGILVALGIILGDLICVFLALFGAKQFFLNESNQQWIALVGGFILVAMGFKYVLKPNTDADISGKFKKKSGWVFFLNGFVINFVNPFVFVVWIGFVSYNQTKYSYSETILSLTFSLITILSTDILKAIFAPKLKRIIQPNFLKKLFQFVGVLMILFGIRLLLVFFLPYFG